jgi:23S rRNA (uracil-5-)-methyltransferase RumA
MRRGERLRLVVERLDIYGRGIARYGDKTIYVNYGLPGDEVEVIIDVHAKGRRGRFKEYYGNIVDLVSAGEGRIDPKCRYFGLCGGCRFQHWEYDRQLTFKREAIYDAAAKWGVETEVNPVIPSPRIWYYRNRMDYAISYDGKVGLKRYGSWSEVIDLYECYLMSPEAVKIMDITRDFMGKHGIPGWDLFKHYGLLRYIVIREGKFTGDRMAIYITYRGVMRHIESLLESLSSEGIVTSIVWGINPTITDISIGKDLRFLWGEDHLTEEIKGLRFHIHPNAFFQTNSYQTIRLVEEVDRYIDGGGLLLDVYSGVGLFSLSYSNKFKEVLGIEVEEESIYSGEISLKWNNISNVRFIRGRAEDVLPRLNDDVDTVILDPPRPGITKKVRRNIEGIRPRKIIYVSCNPDTMMRDISYIEGYKLSLPIQPIDLFPHTPHIESIAVLERV